jgi:NDP-sugar pyrophosphorylase family protein
MIKQALILAGGFGTRLGKLTKDTPKPMLLVNNRPFVEYLVLNLKKYGVNNIIFSTGYYSKKIINFFGDGSSYGINISYVEELSPLGTGGAVKNAFLNLDSEFMVLNGDSLFDINYKILSDLLIVDKNALVSIALRETEDVSRYGSVLTSGDYVKAFNEKSLNNALGLINGGVYIMKKEVLDSFSDGKSSLEQDWFPKLAGMNKLLGKKVEGYFIDIGVLDDFNRSQTELPIWAKTFNIKS